MGQRLLQSGYRKNFDNSVPYVGLSYLAGREGMTLAAFNIEEVGEDRRNHVKGIDNNCTNLLVRGQNHNISSRRILTRAN